MIQTLKELYKNDKRNFWYSASAIITSLLFLIGATYAYFQSQTRASQQIDIDAQTKTVDYLSFSKGSDITVRANQETFAQYKGNQSDSSYVEATLRANNHTNTASAQYHVYIYIEDNSFDYVTQNDEAEILLTVSGPSAVTSIEGLGTPKTVTYSEKNATTEEIEIKTVTGFDITNKTGLYEIVAPTITVNNSTEPTVQRWNITVTLVNLDADQTENTGKELNAKVIIQKASSYLYWNDNFSNETYKNILPTSATSTIPSSNYYIKSASVGTTNVYEVNDNNNPYTFSISDDYDDNYDILVDLAQEYNFLTLSDNESTQIETFTVTNGETHTFNYSDWDPSDITKIQSLNTFIQGIIDELVQKGYVTITGTAAKAISHQSCLYYNNNEFCMNNEEDHYIQYIFPNEMSATPNKYQPEYMIVTKPKSIIPFKASNPADYTTLKTEMEAALGTTATSCTSDEYSVKCTFGENFCESSYSTGYLINSCGSSSSELCFVDSDYAFCGDFDIYINSGDASA